MIFCQISKVLHYKIQKDGEARATPASPVPPSLHEAEGEKESRENKLIRKCGRDIRFKNLTQSGIHFWTMWIFKISIK